MDSILTTIKTQLGIEESDTHFDQDIILYINSSMLSINQLGVGPETGVFITGYQEEWSTLLGDRKDIEAVKTLIFLKVKLLFDPPSNSFVLEAIKEQIKEFEWRINIQVDIPATEGGVVDEG